MWIRGHQIKPLSVFIEKFRALAHHPLAVYVIGRENNVERLRIERKQLELVSLAERAPAYETVVNNQTTRLPRPCFSFFQRH